MSLSDIKWGAVTIAALALVIVGLAVTVKIQHASNIMLSDQKQQAERDKTTAEAITDNVITAVTLMNDIYRATHEKKANVAAAAGARVVSIRNQLTSDACANTRIDSAAVEQLRQYADGLRQSPLRTDQQ